MFLIERNSHYYMYLETVDKYFKDNVRRCLEFLFGLNLHPLQALLVSETLTRLCKHTCSPEPSLITSVISTSRVFTSSYGAPPELISCSGPSCVEEKSTHIE